MSKAIAELETRIKKLEDQESHNAYRISTLYALVHKWEGFTNLGILEDLYKEMDSHERKVETAKESIRGKLEGRVCALEDLQLWIHVDETRDKIERLEDATIWNGTFRSLVKNLNRHELPDPPMTKEEIGKFLSDYKETDHESG
tara:strand:- start:138 stop:569 length:432 start_codon:yes stop_codon:yes gene_type:complete